MIIVEGPDGSGKTTLIKFLTEATGMSVAPRVVSKDAEAMVDLRRWTKDNIAQGFQRTIFDRHRLVSELIYGPVLRDQAEPGFDDIGWLYEHLHGLYREVKPFIIYCLPPASVVWENVMRDPDNARFHGAPQAVRQIYSLYRNKAALDQVLYNRSYVYDYTDLNTAVALRTYFARIFREVTH